jgi:hypothetical protein
MSNQVGVLVGALIGGAVIIISSEATVMFMNGITFFVSAICLVLTSSEMGGVAQPGTASADGAKRSVVKIFYENLREGARFYAAHPSLSLMYLAFLVFFVRLPLANAILPLYAKTVFHGNAATFAMLDAATGIGGLLAGFFLPALSRFFGEKVAIIAGTLAMSVSLVCFGLSRYFWVSLILNFCVGFIFHIWVLFLTVIQRELPIAFQGRVHSFFDVLVQVTALTCFALIGWFSSLPIWWFYILYGCIAFPLISGLIYKSGMFSNVREVEHAIP